MNPESIEEIFNEHQNENFDMVPVDRSLDPIKVANYLKSFKNDYNRYFAETIIVNTLYINYDNFKSKLIESFERFKTNIKDKPFMIMFSCDKIGSETWLTHILWPKITQLNFQGFMTSHGDDFVYRQYVEDILIIDDCAYSGNNILTTIDITTYILKESFTFHLVVPFISDSLMDNLKSMKSDFATNIEGANSNFNVEYYNVNKLLFIEKNIDLFFPNGIDDIEKYKSVFDLQMVGCPIYFDHKVANNFGTFPSIYLEGLDDSGIKHGSLLKTDPSRYVIEYIANFYKDILPKKEKQKDDFQDIIDVLENITIVETEEDLISKEINVGYIGTEYKDYNVDKSKYYDIYKTLSKSNYDVYHISEIIPNKLYLGPYEVNPLELSKLGITHIVSCGFGLNTGKFNSFIVKQYDILDSPNQDITPILIDSCDYIRKLLKNSIKVYVYCLAGISRSASVVIGYIGKNGRTINGSYPSFLDSYNYVYSKRSAIHPNESFCYQLIKYLS